VVDEETRVDVELVVGAILGWTVLVAPTLASWWLAAVNARNPSRRRPSMGWLAVWSVVALSGVAMVWLSPGGFDGLFEWLVGVAVAISGGVAALLVASSGNVPPDAPGDRDGGGHG
jgi:hypothetical protein